MHDVIAIHVVLSDQLLSFTDTHSIIHAFVSSQLGDVMVW